MKEPKSYRCNGCKRVAPATEYCISAKAHHSTRRIDVIYGYVDNPDYRHYCGQSCAIKAISQAMAFWGEK